MLTTKSLVEALHSPDAKKIQKIKPYRAA